MDFLIIALAYFTIRDACLPVGDHDLEEESVKLDFDVDSDVSDQWPLDLKEELGRLGTEKAGRDLADATIALQELNLSRWKR